MQLILTISLLILQAVVITRCLPYTRSTTCQPGSKPNQVKMEEFLNELEQANFHLQQMNLLVNVTYEEQSNTIALLHQDHFVETGFDENSCQNYQIYNPGTSMSICKWKYVCDHEPGRFPPYIYHARCNNEIFHYQQSANTRRQIFNCLRGDKQCQCKAVTMAIKVLRFKGCNPATDEQQWQLESQNVNVGCSCATSSNF